MPAIPKYLVPIDPEAPAGFRRVSYDLRVSGRSLRSPAMRKLVQGLVRDQMAFAERERLEAAWVERQLATAPPLTAYQTKMLRRVKTELTKAARSGTDEPARRAA
ncbi:hypothetical protein KBY91_15295 [Streptomyces sp. RK23]|uniref:hypothetical protein n=1 Tax=unclassified Streptomyces TaxID=2593676 RepID=UPI001B35A59D|nr:MULTISPECIES: hypothetical protein [unclassified Streptomyces]MBQ0969193.1 hypothetical protein [Streptomyces sp. RK74B]MBQ1004774.1 hypothetical protein [Streptomyces sp. RK23]